MLPGIDALFMVVPAALAALLTLLDTHPATPPLGTPSDRWRPGAASAARAVRA
jgi:hypothetical protein